MLSFATCFYDDIEVGVMITASHNPKDQNGMKSIWHTGEPINLKMVGPEIVQIMEQYVSVSCEPKIETRDVSVDWTDRVLSFSQTKDFSKLKIVVDG